MRKKRNQRASIFPVLVIIFLVATFSSYLLLRHFDAHLSAASQRTSAPLTPVSDLDTLWQPPKSAPPKKGAPLGRILMYHYVRSVAASADPLGYRLSVTPETLSNQVAALAKAGYISVTIDQLLSGKYGPKAVALTFDDGYEDFYQSAYPILAKAHFTATLYIISGKIGGSYLTWSQIRQLQRAGFEIGAHTIHHPDLSKLSPAKQRQEIFGSKAAIEAQIGQAVTAFCYPSGRYNQTTLELVREAGFSSATTTQPGVVTTGNNPLLLPRLRILPGSSIGGLLSLR